MKDLTVLQARKLIDSIGFSVYCEFLKRPEETIRTRFKSANKRDDKSIGREHTICIHYFMMDNHFSDEEIKKILGDSK